MISSGIIPTLCTILTVSLCVLGTDVRVNLGVDSSKPVLGDLPEEPHTCDLQSDITGETCQELYSNGATKSGVYTVAPGFRVYCSMGHLKGGWAVILRRVNQSQVFLSKSYKDFVDGFGDFSGDYFLGLESIHSLTKERTYELYIGMEYPASEKVNFVYSKYRSFSVGDKKSGYNLILGEYDETSIGENWHAGLDSLKNHNGAAFSARGSPGNEHCGINYGGWWYSECDHAFYYECNYMKWHQAIRNVELVSFVMAIREV